MVRDDGTIRADAHLTRCGVFNYLQPDGTVRRELRLPEEVFNQDALSSFSGVPVTNDHPPEMVTADNAKKYTVGAIQGDVCRDDDHVRGRVAVYDGDTINDMRSGKTQVSLGYVCDLEEKGGTHPEYGPYDAIQRNIRGNHLAIVDTARAGSSARVRLDAAERIDEWSEAAREASAEARRANAKGPSQVASEIAKHGKEYEAKKGQKPAKMSKAAAQSEFQRLREAPKKAAAAEWQRLRGEKASKEKTAELAKYAQGALSKKDAGILGRRTDEAEEKVGTDIASCEKRARVLVMAEKADEKEPAAQGGKPASKDPDPKDLASRNAAGETAAKAKDKAKPFEGAQEEEENKKDEDEDGSSDVSMDSAKDPDDDGDDDSDKGGDDDDDAQEPDHEDPDDDSPDKDEDDQEAVEDAYTASYDDAGKLTEEARHKMSTSSFAVPDREGLPIHDPEHTRAAMARFGQYEFKDPEEKHAAFNRITKRAKHFGVSSDGFEKAHKNTLDHQDDDDMINQKLKAERDAAVARADKADKALAKAQGELASAKKDLEAAQKNRIDADQVQAQVTAKVELLDQARKVGATVDAKMSDIEIKRAVVKHVDGDDVPAEKPEAYVDALFDGAIRRAKKYTQDTVDGEAALLAARQAAAGAPAAPVQKNDAGDLDEEAAAARARARSADAWTQTWKRQEN